MAADKINIDRYIRLPEVRHLTGLSKASIYSLIVQGKFPKQVKLGDRASAWVESEVRTWMQSRAQASGLEGAA